MTTTVLELRGRTLRYGDVSVRIEPRVARFLMPLFMADRGPPDPACRYAAVYGRYASHAVVEISMFPDHAPPNPKAARKEAACRARRWLARLGAPVTIEPIHRSGYRISRVSSAGADAGREAGA